MLVLVDLDGVLADFERAFYETWVARYPERPAIALAERRTFALVDQYPSEWGADVLGVVGEPGFYASMEPIAGGREALEGMVSAGHDVRICSSPLRAWRHCVAEKYAWVERHLGAGWTERVILTRDKTLVRGDVLIDDKAAISGVHVPSFVHLVFDAPYNQESTSLRVSWSTWEALLGGVRLDRDEVR